MPLSVMTEMGSGEGIDEGGEWATVGGDTPSLLDRYLHGSVNNT